MGGLSTNAIFTLRDLNRRPAKVLEAVRKFGRVMIRTRSGEEFSVTRVETPERRADLEFPDFAARWKRLRELGNRPPASSESARINRLIAGER